MSQTTAGTSGPLAGIRVLNSDESAAGLLLERLLADQGALVERPRAGSPSRGSVDVIVIAPDDAEPRREGRAPGLITCAMPAFAPDDPRSAMPSFEGVVLAAAGAYSHGGGMFGAEWWPDAGVAFSPLPAASVFAALQAAVGVAAALIARQRDGEGQHVCVPMFDAFHEAVGARVLAYEKNAPDGNLLGSALFRCADGRHVSLVTVWYRHLGWFLEEVGRGAWLDEPFTFPRLMADPALREDLRGRLAAIFATRTAAEWERVGLTRGVPLVAVRTSGEWAAAGPSPWVPTLSQVLDRPAVRVRTGACTEGMGASPRSGAGPLGGIRVLDVTRVLAAPMVARVLAELGADVLRVDGNEGESGLRQPILHESANRGKRCVRLDLKSGDGRARFGALVGGADVVITNLTEGAVQRLGLDAVALRSVNEQVIHARIHGFGPDAPASEARGFAEIANAVTGVTARTLDPSAPTGVSINADLPRIPFTDYAAGLLGSYGVLLALYTRLATGRVAEVETTLVDAAAIMQLPFLEAASRGEPEPAWSPLGWAPLHRAFRAADGWLVAGLDDETALRFLEVADSGPGIEELETLLEKTIASRTVDAAVRGLVASGGAAHAVIDIATLLEPGGPSDRAGLRLALASDRFGAVVQPGPAIGLSRTPIVPGGLPVETDCAEWIGTTEEEA